MERTDTCIRGRKLREVGQFIKIIVHREKQHNCIKQHHIIKKQDSSPLTEKRPN